MVHVMSGWATEIELRYFTHVSPLRNTHRSICNILSLESIAMKRIILPPLSSRKLGPFTLYGKFFFRPPTPRSLLLLCCLFANLWRAAPWLDFSFVPLRIIATVILSPALYAGPTARYSLRHMAATTGNAREVGGFPSQLCLVSSAPFTHPEAYPSSAA